MTCDRPTALLSCPLDVEPGGSPCAEIIGRVAFLTHRGEEAEAILHRSGRWHCPQLPILDRVLNALYAPQGPAGGSAYGQAELQRVARWFRHRRPWSSR